MTATDHRGETVGSTIGDYDFIFNNTWFNTSSNLSGQTQKLFLSTPIWLPVIT